MTADLVMMK